MNDADISNEKVELDAYTRLYQSNPPQRGEVSRPSSPGSPTGCNIEKDGATRPRQPPHAIHVGLCPSQILGIVIVVDTAYCGILKKACLDGGLVVEENVLEKSCGGTRSNGRSPHGEAWHATRSLGLRGGRSDAVGGELSVH